MCRDVFLQSYDVPHAGRAGVVLLFCSFCLDRQRQLDSVVTIRSMAKTKSKHQEIPTESSQRLGSSTAGGMGIDLFLNIIQSKINSNYN